jgi:hypothetical protein
MHVAKVFEHKEKPYSIAMHAYVRDTHPHKHTRFDLVDLLQTTESG